MTVPTLMQTHLIWAFIVASFTSGVGKGHQYEALFFVLIMIFGVFDDSQIIVVTFLHVVLIFVNELYRASRP